MYQPAHTHLTVLVYKYWCCFYAHMYTQKEFSSGLGTPFLFYTCAYNSKALSSVLVLQRAKRTRFPTLQEMRYGWKLSERGREQTRDFSRAPLLFPPHATHPCHGTGDMGHSCVWPMTVLPLPSRAKPCVEMQVGNWCPQALIRKMFTHIENLKDCCNEHCVHTTWVQRLAFSQVSFSSLSLPPPLFMQPVRS